MLWTLGFGAKQSWGEKKLTIFSVLRADDWREQTLGQVTGLLHTVFQNKHLNRGFLIPKDSNYAPPY